MLPPIEQSHRRTHPKAVNILLRKATHLMGSIMYITQQRTLARHFPKSGPSLCELYPYTARYNAYTA